MEIAVYEEPLPLEPAEKQMPLPIGASGPGAESPWLSQPVAAMEVPLQPCSFPWSPWQERRTWFFVELDAQQFVVVEDARRRRALVLRFPSGETLAEFEAVRILYDARAHRSAIELLYATSNRMEYARVDPAEGSVERRPILDMLDGPSAAAFIACEPGAPHQDEVVALTPAEAHLRLAHISLSSGLLASVDLGFTEPRQKVALLRVAARAQGERTWFLVADAGYDSDDGAAVSLNRRVGGSFSAPLWRYTENPNRGEQAADRGQYGRGRRPYGQFGQAIALLADQGDDGAPEGLLSSPTAIFDARVELVSLDRDFGSVLGGYVVRFGTSLSATARGDYVLVGGTSFSYPDSPLAAGFAKLLRVTTLGTKLRVIGSWRSGTS